MSEIDLQVVVLDPDLKASRLEVAASPMLGLIEIRRRTLSEIIGERLTTGFLDVTEAKKLKDQLGREMAKLEGEFEDVESPGPGERFEVVPKSGPKDACGWMVFDHVRWGVLSAQFPVGPQGHRDAMRYVEQLNESDRQTRASGREEARAT